MKSGLQNEEFIQRMKESGSLALKGKNDRGVNIFSGSVKDDGVISGRLVRPRYNISELKKSINLEITELLPFQAPDTGDFVTRSLYEEEQVINQNLTIQITSQSAEISSLVSKVNELEAVTQSLNVELDGLQLTNETLDRQLSVTQESFSSTNIDLQTAIQNSTQEAIQRVSLSARNESLKQEVELLREQLFGKQSQLEAGAQSSGTLFTANTSPIRDKDREEILIQRDVRTGFLGRSEGPREWVNGETVTIFNSTDKDLNIQVTREGDTEWLQPVSNKTVPANDTISFKLKMDKSKYDGRSKNDKTGALVLSATRADGVQESVSIPARFRRYR